MYLKTKITKKHNFNYDMQWKTNFYMFLFQKKTAFWIIY